MLWLKTIGIVLVMTGFGSWGLNQARRIRSRVEQLAGLRLGLNFLLKEITYIHTPLPQALKRTAQFSAYPVSVIFKEVACCLEEKQGNTASEAWQKGMQKLSFYSELTLADLELLSTLGYQIGMSDAKEQERVFLLVQEELKLLEEEAVKACESGQKLWSYSGFVLGAVVVLLLI
ncbi:MAG: stage III sporulation protein AB [Syntrophomonadaceae bacterium]|nr:stage III sporulation protein AB [Syntrophomonadaceae bacterium]